MNRWTWAAAAATLAFASPSTFAQAQRQLPADVRPARMAVSATPPDIQLDGQPDRLSPGARIRGTNNLMVLSGSLAGQTVPVVYRRDPSGLVHEVWILTDEEDAQLRKASATGLQAFLDGLAAIFGSRK